MKCQCYQHEMAKALSHPIQLLELYLSGLSRENEWAPMEKVACIFLLLRLRQQISFQSEQFTSPHNYDSVDGNEEPAVLVALL